MAISTLNSRIKIHFFGQIAEMTGAGEMVLELGDTTDNLRKQMEEMYPALRGITYSIAVNKEIIHSNTQLKPADVVAFLPPFSGG